MCWNSSEEKGESGSASDTSGPYEVRSKKIPSLKIRLPMVAVRKSLREKKQVQVGGGGVGVGWGGVGWRYRVRWTNLFVDNPALPILLLNISSLGFQFPK